MACRVLAHIGNRPQGRRWPRRLSRRLLRHSTAGHGGRYDVMPSDVLLSTHHDPLAGLASCVIVTCAS